MDIILKIYVAGIILAVLMLIVLAIHEKKQGNDISEFPTSMIIAAFSWAAVIVLLVCYKDVFICPKNKNDKL